MVNYQIDWPLLEKDYRVLARRRAQMGTRIAKRKRCGGSNTMSKKIETWRRSYTTVRFAQMDSIPEETYDPQFGLESITSANFALDALAKIAGISIPDIAIRELEGIILLLTNLSQQNTATGVITSILLYVQGRTSKALYTHLEETITDMFVTEQSDAIPDWLSCLRNIRTNWSLCKSNRAFKQISKLVGLLVTMGMCDASQMTFSLGQFTFFEPYLMEKHTNAWDLADAMFETIIFFTEGMYLCFQTGSIKPLLVNDRMALELDEEYARILAWWELVKNGNLKKFAKMEDSEFEYRLNLLSTNLKVAAQSLKGLDKKLVNDKFMKIVMLQNEFITRKVASGLRHAPFMLEFFGDSSQGKTMCSEQLVSVLLAGQEMPIDKRYRCAYNPGDKYMSNWTSDKTVLIFDDVANEKSGFVERPPTRAIIDICNNQMFYAPKAELEAKGKCFVEPWIGVITTNKKDLDAYIYSNCPYSIQRRAIVITVKAKREFCKIKNGIACGVDTKKVEDFYTVDGEYQCPLFDDIWYLTVEEAVQPAKLTEVAGYEPIEWRGQKMVDVSMATVVQWASEAFAIHRANQNRIVNSMNAREGLLHTCHVEDCYQIRGNCPDHPILEEEAAEELVGHEVEEQVDEELVCQECDEQFGAETLKTCTNICSELKTRFLPNPGDIQAKVDVKAAELLYDFCLDYTAKWDWVKLIPAPFMEHDKCHEFLRWAYSDRIEADAKEAARSLWINSFAIAIIFALFVPFGFCFAVFVLCQACYLQKHLLQKIEDQIFNELKETNIQISPIVQRYRDNYAKQICKISIAIAAIYGLAMAYRAKVAKDKLNFQGSLEPTTQEQVDERDNEENVWTQVIQKELPTTETHKTTTVDVLEKLVEKNLVYGTIHLDDGTAGRMNCLFLDSNRVLVPVHYFNEYGDVLNITFRKKNPEASGGKFAARLSRFSSHPWEKTDLALCYCPTGGSFRNLKKHLPIGEIPIVPIRMSWRQRDGTMLKAKGLAVPGEVQTYMKFKGGAYKNLTMDTFGGLCGATSISDTNSAMIVGIHLGGAEGTPMGVYGIVTQEMMTEAEKQLRDIPGVALTGSAGTFREKVLDVQVTLNNELHKKSPLNYLPKNSQLEYLGSVIGRSKSVSSVKVTPISTHITDVCGVPNIYGPPKMNPEWYGWQTCLENLAVPALPYSHRLLAVAIKDYQEDLMPVFASALWNGAKPLTDKENLCGIVGKRFIDPIKLNTSIGMPLSGPKRKIVDDLEPTEDFPNNRELQARFMEEIVYCENEYRQGRRCYPIAKACKKDEILSKEKCRIFYGNPLTLTWLIRKYYLPLMRVMMMNPLKSECAVGINAHSQEWDEFHHFVLENGEERLIGGDYGKYDQKLPSQLIIAAMKCFIDFSKQCEGYTDDDRKIMEALIGDVVFAYVAFNGDLVGFTEGTHISGNSLTVIINGICGSLNMRCAFYTFYPPKDFDSRMKFRDFVNLMTYGDDNIGSTKEGCDKFNIKAVSEFLAEYGQVYTMPDKESELVDYLPIEEFEFLKRYSVYHPQLGCYVGALLDKSIYKSLHAFMRPKGCVNTEDQACALNIDTALREWFNHGEEKYESQRKAMRDVASRAGISHMCTRLDVTYLDSVKEWHENYSQSGD